MKILQRFLPPTPQDHKITDIVKWLWVAWRGNRLQASFNASIGIFQVILSLLQVWAVQHAIDIASGVQPGSVKWAVVIMGAITLGGFALSIASVWVRNILGIRAQNQMQQRLLDRLLRTEWQGRERLHSGDVLNRLEGDVGNVISFLTETIPGTLSTLALFVGAFWYLLSMDAVLALITVGIIPVFVLVSRIYVQQMRHLTREVRTQDSRVQSVLQETLQHRMLIKTLESINTMVNRLEDTQSVLRQRVVRRTRFSVWSNLVLNVGFAFGYLVAFLWAALRLADHTLTFGGMTAFLQLVNRIQSPARSLTQLVPAFVSVLTAAERLMELEETPLEDQGDPQVIKSPCGIRFTNVKFSYPDAPTETVLEGLNCQFRPGTCTAILGETGAGKTTLVRIILGLLRPVEGKATIYNDYKELPLSPRTRCNLVYVPQGNTLLSGTLRDNLRLAKPQASEQEMLAALHQSCADFVKDLPQGLDTECGEVGTGLSEGQAQRIAIARALLRDRPIMLLDEATSALDPETERELLQRLLADKKRTVIFVTHRPAVIDFCDQTLRIEKL